MKTLPTTPPLPHIFNVAFCVELLRSWGAEVRGCYTQFDSLMRDYKDYVPFLIKYVEEATTGDPSWSAYLLCESCGASLEWAMKIVEKSATGDPSHVAYLLFRHCGASLEWYNKIKGGHQSLNNLKKVFYYF